MYRLGGITLEEKTLEQLAHEENSNQHVSAANGIHVSLLVTNMVLIKK